MTKDKRMEDKEQECGNKRKGFFYCIGERVYCIGDWRTQFGKNGGVELGWS